MNLESGVVEVQDFAAGHDVPVSSRVKQEITISPRAKRTKKDTINNGTTDMTGIVVISSSQSGRTSNAPALSGKKSGLPGASQVGIKLELEEVQIKKESLQNQAGVSTNSTTMPIMGPWLVHKDLGTKTLKPNIAYCPYALDPTHIVPVCDADIAKLGVSFCVKVADFGPAKVPLRLRVRSSINPEINGWYLLCILFPCGYVS